MLKSHLRTIFYVLKNSWIKGENTKWRQSFSKIMTMKVFWIQWNIVKAVLKKKEWNTYIYNNYLLTKKHLKTMVKKQKHNKINHKGPKRQILYAGD